MEDTDWPLLCSRHIKQRYSAQHCQLNCSSIDTAAACSARVTAGQDSTTSAAVTSAPGKYAMQSRTSNSHLMHSAQDTAHSMHCILIKVHSLCFHACRLNVLTYPTLILQMDHQQDVIKAGGSMQVEQKSLHDIAWVRFKTAHWIALFCAAKQTQVLASVACTHLHISQTLTFPVHVRSPP